MAFISAFFSVFSRHRDLALENLALRQQLAVFKRRHPRPKLRPVDRLFWIWLSTVWAGWRETQLIVKPETVIAWHRQVFRFYWHWLSRRKSLGRSTVSSASLVDELRRHKDFQQITRQNFGERYKDLDLVFTMPLGAPVNTDVLGSKYFKPLVEKAGLPSTIRLYDLRHTMATLLLLAGENPKVVSERLGHSSIAITLDVYSHVLPTMQQAATSKLERLLWGSDPLLTHRPENTKGSEDISNPQTLAKRDNTKSWEAGIRIQPRQGSHRRQAG